MSAGCLAEVHPHPEVAFSDGAQSLKPKKFDEMMRQLAPLLGVMGKVPGK